ncbi:MAG TPA: SpoIIE family protein phosphatase [Anaerolineae bacterium]|nr:SpoIIE family protein phosphatase [Anaerolineae bacterium]
MADTKATATLLRTVPFLGGLSGADYAALARRSRERAFKAGKTIFREGSQGTTLWIIKDGEVDIVKGRGRDEVTLVTRRAGEFFGEMGIIEGAKRSATTRARSDVTLIEVPGDTVMKTLLKHPPVLLETTRQLSSNLRQADTTMIQGLKKKNAELRRAYKALQEAQDEIVEKKRLERELELARELQDSLLPRELPHLPGLQFAGRSRPAEAVGGDFYDVIPIRSNLFGLLIASVAGQGLFAAIFMALTRALIVSEGQRQEHPHVVASNVHRLLLQLAKPTMPVSMFYGLIDVREGAVTYVNAGHAAPLVRNADGSVAALAGAGTQLAASLRVQVDERATTVQAGQTLVLHTEGLTRTENPAGESFGAARLKAVLGDQMTSAEDLVDRLFAAVDAHRAEAAQRRDQALLVVHASG